jgi:hypothetical protein
MESGTFQAGAARDQRRPVPRCQSPGVIKSFRGGAGGVSLLAPSGRMPSRITRVVES